MANEGEICVGFANVERLFHHELLMSLIMVLNDANDSQNSRINIL